MHIRILIYLGILLLGCEEPELRNIDNRPSEDGSSVPDFELETKISAKAGEAVSIKVGSTKLTLEEGALSKDSEIRLRKLDTVPERDELAEFGSNKGDIIEVKFFESNSEAVFGSDLLDSPYSISQTVNNVEDYSNLQVAILIDPDTSNEKLKVISKNGISNGDDSSLSLANFDVNFQLAATYLVLYVFESQTLPPTTITIESGSEAVSKGNTISKSSDCPTQHGNFIPVPNDQTAGLGGAQNGVPAFCVAKYEMSQEGELAASKMGGIPWVSLSQSDAVEKCRALGAGYNLISNPQWQSLARNIELAKDSNGIEDNWYWDEYDGQSFINQGHSNNAPARALESLADPSPCVQNECAETVALLYLMRTHKLSNGEIIWDFSGNVAEWIMEINLDYSTSSSSDPLTMSPDEKLMWGPAKAISMDDGGFGGVFKLGLFYPGEGKAIYRGGVWSNVEGSGVFNARLDVADATYSSNDVGFRCVWSP